jgi:small subunit ribosomal protein S3
MGQKINPTGFRLAFNRGWTSRWFAGGKSFGEMLNEDLKVRDYLKTRLSHASVSKVLIERPAKDARITIHSARPGVVIGKKGEDIEILKAELRKLLGVQMVHVNIEEIRKPEIDAQLIADSITQQLEKRIMFRRAMKRAIQNAMRLGAQGIKIMSAGRLNGIEIARTEWYREGRVPLHTLRADIDYGFSEAKTSYGVIGVKVWVYKGEVLGKQEQAAAPAPAPAEEEPRRIRRGPPPGARGPARAEPQPAAPAAEAKRPAARPRLKKPAEAGDKPAESAKPEAPVPAPEAPKKPPLKRVVKKSTGGSSDASTS